jgi:hypothetical protein
MCDNPKMDQVYDEVREDLVLKVNNINHKKLLFPKFFVYTLVTESGGVNSSQSIP